jgi:hypothetical protein
MSTTGSTGTTSADAQWFDKHLEQELQKLFTGKTDLSGFKCFLMPNAWYLDLPLDHKVHEIKGILAEQHTYDSSMSDEKMVEILKKL